MTSSDMTWSQDLQTTCGIDVRLGTPNLAALRNAVFSLAPKNLRVVVNNILPPAGRGLKKQFFRTTQLKFKTFFAV